MDLGKYFMKHEGSLCLSQEYYSDYLRQHFYHSTTYLKNLYQKIIQLNKLNFSRGFSKQMVWII
jgi:hypothetical protein